MKNRNWDIFASESPTEIHHKNCSDTPESHHTGDATENVILEPRIHAKEEEEFDLSCNCLDPILGDNQDASRC
jgi:hypothetical protein